jgi:hypothetical protein
MNVEVVEAIGICHTGYVDCLLARSSIAVNTVLRLLMMDSKSVRNM